MLGVIAILPRKIITASLSGTLFAIIFGFLIFPFSEEYIGSPEGYLLSAISITSMYMMFSFPIILFYGVVTSLLSDRVGKFLSTNANNQMELVTSAILHIAFGLILLWGSLVASILFFITDRLLGRLNKKFHWKEALISLTIPIMTLLIFNGISLISDMFN
ncbi:hypothetical protein [Mesobacillus foraminis]|uniref:hypothetical protein n=1 Tax=Mesobacillus foraminis TaxID=279826 RepID=UPI000EF49261|nr:hypothetical protein [Mesobacillus foraminis]